MKKYLNKIFIIGAIVAGIAFGAAVVIAAPSGFWIFGEQTFPDGNDQISVYDNTTKALTATTFTGGANCLTYSAGVIDSSSCGGGSGDVVGPSSAVNRGFALFDGTTGKLIRDSNGVSGTTANFSANSSFQIAPDHLNIGNSTSGYTASLYESINGATGLDIRNTSTGTSKISQIFIHSAATTGADTWGTIATYASNYTDTSLASRFVIEGGTSQSMLFKTDSGFVWRTNTTEDMRLTAGHLGIAITPTALITTKAGTTAASSAPLKFTSGTNMTTAEAGAFEYDGKDLFFTPIGTIRKTIPTVVTGRSTAQTAAVASVATQTVGASDASYLISSNVLVTTATVHSFTATVAYTDEGNTARTVTLQFSTLAGAFVTAMTNAQGTVPYEGVPLHIRAKSGTTITIATTGTFTTVVYNVEGSITKIN